MNTNEYLLDALRAEGLTHVFMVPGGLIEFRPAFETALAARKPYLLDVRCDKAFTTPVTPFDRAKKEWHDDV